MKITTAEQMRDLDRRAVEQFGVPSIVLMENAGRHVFKAVSDLLGSPVEKRVVVIAGSGNNGGDGFVAARLLHESGVSVSVLLLTAPCKISGDAAVNFEMLQRTGVPIQQVSSLAQVESALSEVDVVVDAIFGTGLRGEVTGLPAQVIRAINDSGRRVVAVDIPSGLDADTGRVLGVCVRAECTVTFALPKLGLILYPGADYVGRLVVGDIGIPEQLCDEVRNETVEAHYVADRLPRRPAESHKGTFGTVVAIAGSAGFTGAAAMAAESALRAGCGLCICAVPVSLQDVMAVKLTEVMTRGLPETPQRSLSSKAVNLALDIAEKASGVVLGCGLGTDPETVQFVHGFLKAVRKATVVDADALNAVAKDIAVLEAEHGELVLTPHPGEMSRLLATSTEKVQSDRLGAAREASSRFHSVIVLKGARTVIAEPGGHAFISTNGNVGLATGGTGDVLAGVIGGLLAQGLSCLDAAVCGAYIHGMAGDIAAREIGVPGMIAGDVMRALPAVFKELRTQ